MKINFEDIKKSGNYSQEINLDFSDVDVEDVLLKKIKNVDLQIDAYMVSTDEAYINFDVTYTIDYLDAYDLTELELTFDFEDNSIFTNDLQKAIEMDLEYLEDGELDIDNLILDLIVVDVPYNYTKTKDTLKTEADFEDGNLQSPFANLFDKKEE